MERWRLSRKEKNTQPLTEEEFIHRQSDVLRAQLKEYNIHGVTVSSDIYRIDASVFEKKKTHAFTRILKETISIVAASNANMDASSTATATMLIAPTQEYSGMSVHEETQTIWTDSFWVCEDSVFKYVRTSSSIPIDGINTLSELERDHPAIENRMEFVRRLFKITEDKQRAKTLLHEHGIAVPNGIFIKDTSNTHTTDVLADFITSNGARDGLVVKGNNGAAGGEVRIRDANDYRGVAEDVLVLNATGNGVLVEDRIVPPASSNLKLRRLRGNGNKEVDYNFRILTTMDREDPQVVDEEIRFREKENTPVNISIDAKAARIDVLEDAELVKQLHHVAIVATKIVCKEAFDPGEKTHGLVGVDAMIDENKNIYVIEVNSGAVGGIGTLTTLDKAPLASVRETLLPAAEPYLEEAYAKRITVEEDSLDRLPHTEFDTARLIAGHMQKKEYKAALDMRLKNESVYTSQEGYFTMLLSVCAQLKEYDAASSYVDSVIARAPNDDTWVASKVSLLRELKRYDDAQYEIDMFTDGRGMTNYMIVSQLFLYAAQDKDKLAERFLYEQIMRGNVSTDEVPNVREFVAEIYEKAGKKRKANALRRKVERSEWMSSFAGRSVSVMHEIYKADD